MSNLCIILYMAHLLIDRYLMNEKTCMSRICVNKKQGIAEAVFYGVEKPWRDNRRFVSCIPAGNYLLEPFRSKKFGDVWCFISVAPTRMDYAVVRNKNNAAGGLRYACLIHAGNSGDDVAGCLAIGLHIIQHRLRVGHSRTALTELHQFLPDRDIHTVEIRWFP